VARLHREILDTLVSRVVDGEYATGALLPKEQALAAEFDISRGTAREALRALEERRVAVVKHGRGARVQAPEEWNALDPIVARALAAGRRRREFLREVRACRQLLESEAAALAAERATVAQRAELRVRADELPEAEDMARAAGRIRRLVAVASGNRPLAATLRALGEAAEPALTAADRDACARMARAIADADADAARRAAAELNATR
jgi:GntR family transcriptional regulator, transcriptional repressor for pyruvate dehydrogenase complex